MFARVAGFFFLFKRYRTRRGTVRKNDLIRVDDSVSERQLEFRGADGILPGRLRFCEEEDRIGEDVTRVHGSSKTGG